MSYKICKAYPMQDPIRTPTMLKIITRSDFGTTQSKVRISFGRVRVAEYIDLLDYQYTWLAMLIVSFFILCEPRQAVSQVCSEPLNSERVRELAATNYKFMKDTITTKGVGFLLCPDDEKQLSRSLAGDQSKIEEIRRIIDQNNCYILGTPDLRIQGSTTIGERLMPRLVYKFLLSLNPGAKPKVFADCGGDRTRFSVREGQDLHVIDVAATDSADGYKLLRNSQIDIAMSSAPQTRDRDIREIAIATDQIGIIVNKLNPLLQLTLEELKGIFGGRITKWSDLNVNIASPGKDQIDDHIIVFSRESGSGTLKEFEDLAGLTVNFKNENLMTVHGHLKMAEAVAETVNGIGYVAAPYLPLNSEVTIVDQEGHFGLQRKLYLYYRDQGFLRRLVGWVEAGLAAETIEQEGFTPSHHPSTPYDCGAEKPMDPRLPNRKELHFDSGMSRLSPSEDHALTNLIPQLSGSELLIVGFTDHVGSDASNKILSEQRAKGVAERLGSKARPIGCGIRHRVEGNEAARISARKVEIWFR
jgi:outer membrane protein OmpA-like peptidoglycan-associated protein